MAGLLLAYVIPVVEGEGERLFVLVGELLRGLAGAGGENEGDRVLDRVRAAAGGACVDDAGGGGGLFGREVEDLDGRSRDRDAGRV